MKGDATAQIGQRKGGLTIATVGCADQLEEGFVL
jgi:hypothetical protein